MTRNKQTLLVIGALVAGVGATSACNRTPAEAHTDAVEAQQQADKTTANAKEEADKKIAEANNDVQKAADDARKEAAEAQAKANEKIRDANRDIVGKDDDVHVWAQKKIDDVNNQIDSAKAKAQTAPAKAKEKFNVAIEKVQHDRDVLQTETASLEASTGDKLDKTKQDFSHRVDQMKDRIHTIEKSL